MSSTLDLLARLPSSAELETLAKLQYKARRKFLPPPRSISGCRTIFTVPGLKMRLRAPDSGHGAISRNLLHIHGEGARPCNPLRTHDSRSNRYLRFRGSKVGSGKKPSCVRRLVPLIKIPSRIARTFFWTRYTHTHELSP